MPARGGRVSLHLSKQVCLSVCILGGTLMTSTGAILLDAVIN